MLVELKLPELGPGVKEAVIAVWRKNVHDSIEVDETIAEVMTEKVNVEVPSPWAGTVADLLHPKDTMVQVGQVIAQIEAQDG